MFDAIVVGSGCTGGWVAKELTEAGLQTLLVEGGPDMPHGEVYLPPEAPRQGAATQQTQAQHPAFLALNPRLFVDDEEHPYTTPKDKPFVWIRGRQVGGRSLTWGRVCLRMSDFELKAASRDGYGEDWPLDSAELAPHYARVERFHSVRGAKDGLAQLPDGDCVDPVPFNAAEAHFKRVVEARWPERRVIAHRGIEDGVNGPAGTWPLSTSQGSTLAAAKATGRLVLRSDAVVTHVLSSGRNKVRGVRFVDRKTLDAEEVEARVVVVCASTIETVRILFNSSTDAHPNGLANSSGMLGRFLMDRPAAAVVGRLSPALRSREPLPWGGPHGVFVPRFRNLNGDERPYRRGFGIWGGLDRGPLPGEFLLIAQGEMLPRAENAVSIERHRADRWGVPLAHIECEWGENDRMLVEDGLACLREMASAAELELTATMPMRPPGSFVHEVGTARMGRNPKTSVLNPDNRAWDVENLFVADGSCFTSAGYQNPTLTMMAIASRAGRFIAAELAAGRL